MIGARFVDRDMVEPPAPAPAAEPLSRPILFGERPDAPTRLPDPAPVAVVAVPPTPRGSLPLLSLGVFGLIATWAAFWLGSFVTEEFRISPVLGGVAAAGCGLSAVLISVGIRREVKAWIGLAQVDSVRRVLGSALADHAEVAEAGAMWLKSVSRQVTDSPLTMKALREAESADEVRELLRAKVARPLADRAAEMGRRAAVECAALVAVSPHEGLDALVAGFRCWRLVRQIATLYGLRPGVTVTFKLLRSIAWTAAGTAGSVALGQSLATAAVAQTPGVRDAAGAVMGGAFDVIRVIRLADVVARACCPLRLG